MSSTCAITNKEIIEGQKRVSQIIISNLNYLIIDRISRTELSAFVRPIEVLGLRLWPTNLFIGINFNWDRFLTQIFYLPFKYLSTGLRTSILFLELDNWPRLKALTEAGRGMATISFSFDEDFSFFSVLMSFKVCRRFTDFILARLGVLWQCYIAINNV